ncbi:hypothetical protein IPF89_00360 [Candidatus Saccharibacteria bacterium]|nr:MAG: hypothetical protein IPF89_00360 [Candidatus Saccharibacteria bacterium]
MLYLPRFTSVRYIRPDEPHWFDSKGHYISGKNGEQHQMSGPEVDTVRYMAGLEPAAQQFDFICMAILRHHSGVIYTMRLMNETECGGYGKNSSKSLMKCRGMVMRGTSCHTMTLTIR